MPSLNLGTRKSIPSKQETPRSKRKSVREKYKNAKKTRLSSCDAPENEAAKDEAPCYEAPDNEMIEEEDLDFFSGDNLSNIFNDMVQLDINHVGREEECKTTATETLSTESASGTAAANVTTSETSSIGGNQEDPPQEMNNEEDAFHAKNKATQTDLKTVSVGTETLSIIPKIRSNFCIEMFENEPETLLHYTGFKDFEHFCFVFSCLEPAVYRLDYKSAKLSRKNEFLLTMIKLRCAKPDVELSFLFGIGKKVVGLIWNTMIRFLYYHLRDMTPWLAQDIVDMYMPLDFKAKYPGTRVILDGTEFFVQKLSDAQDQSATWSSYKNHSTLKSMIGISPRGVVTHVSQTYGGCTSDRQIIERSELIKKGMFTKGDSIMADRGIMVQDMFASMDVKVNTPTMLRGRSQLTSEEVIKDRRIAAKRIHVERVIGLAKTYKILASQIHHSQRPLADKIVFVCFALCNFRPSIIGKYA